MAVGIVLGVAMVGAVLPLAAAGAAGYVVFSGSEAMINATSPGDHFTPHIAALRTSCEKISAIAGMILSRLGRSVSAISLAVLGFAAGAVPAIHMGLPFVFIKYLPLCVISALVSGVVGLVLFSVGVALLNFSNTSIRNFNMEHPELSVRVKELSVRLNEYEIRKKELLKQIWVANAKHHTASCSLRKALDPDFRHRYNGDINSLVLSETTLFAQLQQLRQNYQQVIKQHEQESRRGKAELAALTDELIRQRPAPMEIKQGCFFNIDFPSC